MTNTAKTAVAPIAQTTQRMPFFAKLHQLVGLQRQRRTLGNLDEHLLNDIGITKAQADEEAARSFWDDSKA